MRTGAARAMRCTAFSFYELSGPPRPPAGSQTATGGQLQAPVPLYVRSMPLGARALPLASYLSHPARSTSLSHRCRRVETPAGTRLRRNKSASLDGGPRLVVVVVLLLLLLPVG